jgi:transposase InsO family protein
MSNREPSSASYLADPFLIGRYLTLYNNRRPHSSLADRTPDEAYFLPRPLAAAA